MAEQSADRTGAVIWTGLVVMLIVCVVMVCMTAGRWQPVDRPAATLGR